MRHFSIWISFALCLSLAVSILSAQQTTTTAVPNFIRYSGTLKDAQGSPLSASTIGVTFAIYKQQDGGAAVWMETQNVTTDASGNYSVLLGSTAAAGLPSDLFSQQEERWLGVQVQGQPEQPRVLLVSVPYAFRASEAERLAGHSISEFVTSDTLQSAVQQQLQQQIGTGNAAPAKSTTSKSAKPSGLNVPTDPATNFVDSTTNQVVGVTQNGSGKAVNATAVQGNAIVGNSTATTGSAAGVEGLSSAPTGFGIMGQNTASTGSSYGVYGLAASTMGIGVQGNASAASGATYGILGYSYSSSGTGIRAGAIAATGSTYGLQAWVNSPTGTAALFQNFSTSTVTGKLLVAKTMATGAQFVVDGSANVTATGSLSGNQLISTVVSGTAPLQVRSTTMVPNLNANSLQGYTASYFAMLGANNFTGTQAVSNGNVTASGTARSHTSGNVVVDASGANNGSDYLPGLLFGGTSSGEAIASNRTLYVNPKGLDFYTNATPRISITSIGLVGIGTQNPTHHAMVEVNANNQGSHTTISGGYFEGTSNAGGDFAAADGADFQGGNSDNYVGGAGVSATGGYGGSGPSGGPGVQGTGGMDESFTGSGYPGGAGGTFTGGGSQNNYGGDGIDATPGTGPTGNGYAGKFNGNVDVTGTITAQTKNFKIDHPLDPANKYLYHASVESSEMMNIYTGNVTTDSQGDAVVELPDWFEAVNTDFRYQLTVIGQFAQAIVASEISNQRLSIKTDKPNVKVSWQVTGVRQDRYAQAHPLQVEVEKPKGERGYYIHPELYGAPAEKSIESARHPQSMKQVK